jgi:hypothetical protein
VFVVHIALLDLRSITEHLTSHFEYSILFLIEFPVYIYISILISINLNILLYGTTVYQDLMRVFL